jgi:hypothetical protein
VPGPETFLLFGEFHIRSVAESLANLIPFVTDHDHMAGGLDLARELQNMVQHGMTAHFVQRFGTFRFQTSTVTGR